MKIVPLKSWEDLENTVSSLFVELETLRIQKQPFIVSTPLFRGHVNASWKLETTLDRITKSDCPMKDYYKIIRAVRPAVISITGKNWELPDSFDDVQDTPKPPPGYEFMIYLRHHGFPSPLLDWSRSPYVAAFFAFRSDGDPKDESVAIYSFVEYLGEAKGWQGSIPTFFGLGPYVISHARHYSQQSEYTVCKKDTPEGHVYCSHEHATVDDRGQDMLIKYVLPKNERGKALKNLEIMNITSFSLFGSEESLMETLAYQELEKALLR